MESREFQIAGPGELLDAFLLVPESPVAGIVLAHGAGAGLRHKNMEAIAQALAEERIASMRFNFPYTQAGGRRVDRVDVACSTIAMAYERAAAEITGPLIMAGHSFGGRMSSLAVAQGLLSPMGLIFFSFPLHQPNKPDRKRAAHLNQIHQPMLFLSGTRDDLADQQLLQTIVDELPTARVHWLETGNHSYVILKRTRSNPLSIFSEMAKQAREFVDEVV